VKKKLAIYQIYYLENQLSKLVKEFIPYDNCANPDPRWREYYVFRNAYLNKSYLNAAYTGYFSWKFQEKTQLSGEEFNSFVRRNPGYDVYFVNPFPDQAAIYKNVWLQGDRCHPGILPFVEKMFRSLSYEISPRELVQPYQVGAFCNYWVGNARFWKEFIEFCEPAYQYIETRLDPEDAKFIHSRADRSIQAPYIPFIMERFFTTFLLTKGKSLKYLGFDYNRPKYLLRRFGPFAPLAQGILDIRETYDQWPSQELETALLILGDLLKKSEKNYADLANQRRKSVAYDRIRSKLLWIPGAKQIAPNLLKIMTR
jgi:hypothetical protein